MQTQTANLQVYTQYGNWGPDKLPQGYPATPKGITQALQDHAEISPDCPRVLSAIERLAGFLEENQQVKSRKQVILERISNGSISLVVNP